ncbi:hypothetical protein K502DRAFT_364135 [Neoconidiobolus thromboides FSU 785]|nr:hypothetical protein K502DRAFT_364135 [Neoconidiobolus thromboides FSU 785]
MSSNNKIEKAEKLEDKLSLEEILNKASTFENEELVNLIKETIVGPDFFYFVDLLALPSVQKLKQNEKYKDTVDLLEIFCFDDLKGFKEKTNGSIKLNKDELKKLRELTLIKLFNIKKKQPYSTLLAELDFKIEREMEDFFIVTAHQGIMKGKVNQKEKHIIVKKCISTEIHPEKIPKLILQLKEWRKRCQGVLSILDDEEKKLDLHYEAKRAKHEEKKEQFITLKSETLNIAKGPSKGGKSKHGSGKVLKRGSYDR